MLDTLINRFLALDPETAEKIAGFSGRIIAVELKGLGKTFYLLPQENGIRIVDKIDGAADTLLSGSPLALFRLGLSSNVAPMMLKGEVDITGNVRLGREFKKILREMDIDWEEHLSKLVGDMTAHRFMQLAGVARQWTSKSASSLTQDVSEYLQEESRDVVSAGELEGFYEDVDRLRNDVDRIEARIENLKQQLEP